MANIRDWASGVTQAREDSPGRRSMTDFVNLILLITVLAMIVLIVAILFR